MNFLLAFVVCYLAVQQVSFAQLLPDFFESSIYKQTVAYDAPVIDPEQTAKLLLQLEPLIPKNAKGYFKDLMSLLYFQDDRNCMGHKFDVLNQADHIECPFSSPSGKKPLGPNILAFIKHYKSKMLNHCASILKQSVKGASSLDFLKEFTSIMLPYNRWPESKEDYEELSSRSTERMQAYLAKTIPNFEVRKRTAQGKNEIRTSLQRIQNSCSELKSGSELRSFVPLAMNSDDFRLEIIKDKQLIEIVSTMELCAKLEPYLNDKKWMLRSREGRKSIYSCFGL